jgi:hypothetical protein
MSSISTDKLREIISNQAKDDTSAMLLADAFSAGCVLHMQGHKEAGLKLCSRVLSSIGYEGRSEYFSQLLESLEGNEASFIADIWACYEINKVARLLSEKV